jgi:hypothetical protein
MIFECSHFKAVSKARSASKGAGDCRAPLLALRACRVLALNKTLG